MIKIWTFYRKLRAKDLILALAKIREKNAPTKLGKLTFSEKTGLAIWNGGKLFTYTVSYLDTEKTRLTQKS